MKTYSLVNPTPGDPLAYVANGLIGLRIGPLPFPQGKALLNGYVAHQRFSGLEGYDFVPYPLSTDICLNGTYLSKRPDLASFERQDYDFSCGELATRFVFSVNGTTATVKVLTFCSRSIPTVALQEVRVLVDSPCRLVLRTRIDHSDIPGRSLQRIMPRDYADCVVHWESEGGSSTCGVAFATELVGVDHAAETRNGWGFEEDVQVKDYAFDALPGKEYVLYQYGSLVPSIMHAEPHWQALRLLGLAKWQGFDKLRDDNRAAWQELWKGRTVVNGASNEFQDALDAAYFYQKSSIHPSSPCSVAPFGLGSREAYYGHVFWDAETFVLPVELLTCPASARAMLEYRSRLLPAARMNAAMNGYLGAQFPWQSYYHGGEVTPPWAGGGITEHHINMDVAHAFAQCVYATDDDLFARQHAWPALQAVAEWITSRVTSTGRGYEILHVTGIDEGHDNVHNDGFTNASAIVVLREAAELARRLGYGAPDVWEQIAANLYLPIDVDKNVIGSRDGAAPSLDVLTALFPLGFSISDEIDRATMEAVVAKSKPGGAMLSGFIGVYAARLGNRPLAREMTETGLLCFATDPFTQFTEVADRNSSIGHVGSTPFLSNPAGTQLSCLYGLTGLRLGYGVPESWAKHPVVLPEGWESIEVERIWAHGRPARLRAVHGAERAEVELI